MKQPQHKNAAQRFLYEQGKERLYDNGENLLEKQPHQIRKEGIKQVGKSALIYTGLAAVGVVGGHALVDRAIDHSPTMVHQRQMEEQQQHQDQLTADPTQTTIHIAKSDTSK